MKKSILSLMVACFMFSGCAGFVCFGNTKGVDARAKASEIQTSKGTIEDARGKVDYGSAVKFCLYWPWKLKGMPAK